jgi:hypothetical protein
MIIAEFGDIMINSLGDNVVSHLSLSLATL